MPKAAGRCGTRPGLIPKYPLFLASQVRFLRCSQATYRGKLPGILSRVAFVQRPEFGVQIFFSYARSLTLI